MQANAQEAAITKKHITGFCLRVHLLPLLLDGPYGGEKKHITQVLVK